MQPRVDIITLGVADVDAARHFFVEGLGWEPALDVPGEIVFIQVGHGLLLGLFSASDLDADIGAAGGRSIGPPAMSLAQVVATEEEVMATLQRAEAAGATILKEPQLADFGGFHGYFADPVGFRWEVATNPGWSVDADGRVTIGPVT
ncbi:MAG: VOC family protein [Actinomycetota bacterium]|nr:VOC family protein [Actinomycetota bacterium]MDQ6945844.1 VOC family protein [Actinomycetota bacterium]